MDHPKPKAISRNLDLAKQAPVTLPEYRRATLRLPARRQSQNDCNDPVHSYARGE
jgi:hypothetical protein